MPALAPQSVRQKLLVVHLCVLLLGPLAFLRIGSGFEYDAARVQREAEDIREGDAGGERGEEGRGEGVESQDGEEAEGDPGRLSHEGAEEGGWGGADLLEARVLAVLGEDLFSFD